jgi:hypothetical protein
MKILQTFEFIDCVSITHTNSESLNTSFEISKLKNTKKGYANTCKKLTDLYRYNPYQIFELINDKNNKFKSLKIKRDRIIQI